MTRIILFFALFYSVSCNAKSPIPVEEQADIVEEIYNRIFDANGFSDVAPRFYFDESGESQVAYMSKIDGVPVISFEGLAFDICAEFGDRRDDAIAFILGHEVSHYTLDHHWGQEFTSSYSFSSLNKFFQNDTLAVTYEAASDERGAILCYLAGFNTRGLAKDILSKIYKEYEFDNNIRGYPTLQERITLAESKDSLVDVYAKIFEAGNYAMLMHDYSQAIDCYGFVKEKFGTREVYNNLGIAYFIKATEDAGIVKVKYLYPVEMDLDSKINQKGSKGFGKNEKKLLKLALKYFKSAIGKDEGYYTAYVNMACVQAALENFLDAREAANYVIKRAVRKNSMVGVHTAMNAELVLAIAYDADTNATAIEKSESIKIVDALIKKGHFLSEINKQVMSGTQIDKIDYTDLSLTLMPVEYQAAKKVEAKRNEMLVIDEFKKNDYYYSDIVAIPGEKDRRIEYRKRKRVSYCDLSSSYVYIFPGAVGKRMVHVTKSNFEGQTRSGLKLGDSKDKLINLYGAPESMITTKQGEILSFPNNHLFILVDSDLTISRIMVYRDPIKD